MTSCLVWKPLRRRGRPVLHVEFVTRSGSVSLVVAAMIVCASVATTSAQVGGGSEGSAAPAGQRVFQPPAGEIFGPPDWNLLVGPFGPVFNPPISSAPVNVT